MQAYPTQPAPPATTGCCSSCIPCCCTGCNGPDLWKPLLILAILSLLSGFSSIDSAETTDDWLDDCDTDACNGIVGALWTYAIINIAGPICFFLSLIKSLGIPTRKLLAIVFVIYLTINAVIYVAIAIIFVWIAVTWDTATSDAADGTTAEDAQETIETILYAIAVVWILCAALCINWAICSWNYTYFIEHSTVGGQTTMVQTTAAVQMSGRV